MVPVSDRQIWVAIYITVPSVDQLNTYWTRWAPIFFERSCTFALEVPVGSMKSGVLLTFTIVQISILISPRFAAEELRYTSSSEQHIEVEKCSDVWKCQTCERYWGETEIANCCGRCSTVWTDPFTFVTSAEHIQSGREPIKFHISSNIPYERPCVGTPDYKVLIK